MKVWDNFDCDASKALGSVIALHVLWNLADPGQSLRRDLAFLPKVSSILKDIQKHLFVLSLFVDADWSFLRHVWHESPLLIGWKWGICYRYLTEWFVMFIYWGLITHLHSYLWEMDCDVNDFVHPTLAITELFFFLFGWKPLYLMVNILVSGIFAFRCIHCYNDIYIYI